MAWKYMWSKIILFESGAHGIHMLDNNILFDSVIEWLANSCWVVQEDEIILFVTALE